MKMFRVLFLALLLLLTGCGVLNQVPPNRAVKLAIAQQLTNTQQSIAQSLGMAPEPEIKPNFTVNRLNVESREKLTGSQRVSAAAISPRRYPGDLYRVRGTFEATLRAPNRKTQQKIQQSSAFEVYLSTDPQDTREIETWFLVKPSEAIPAAD